MEGMRGFLDRHAADLERERTRFVVLESLGSPELILLEGEGMIRMRDYSPALKDELAEAAADAGHPLRRRLRTGLATDALLPLLAGYDDGVHRILRRVQDGVQLPLAARHARPRGLRHRGARGRRVRAGAATAQPASLSSSRARVMASSRVAMSPAKRSSSS